MRYAGILLAGMFLTGLARGAEVDAAAVHSTVESLRASAGPRDWRKLPWVASLLEARKISRDEKAPIFLFTYDGNIDSGRC